MVASSLEASERCERETSSDLRVILPKWSRAWLRRKRGRNRHRLPWRRWATAQSPFKDPFNEGDALWWKRVGGCRLGAWRSKGIGTPRCWRRLHSARSHGADVPPAARPAGGVAAAARAGALAHLLRRQLRVGLCVARGHRLVCGEPLGDEQQPESSGAHRRPAAYGAPKGSTAAAGRGLPRAPRGRALGGALRGASGAERVTAPAPWRCRFRTART